jgi:probable phosphoglycerate mutase
MSLYLARHGETEWNRAGRLQGRDDSPLTQVGVEHAVRLGAFARALRVRRILTSPLGRALATARIVVARIAADQSRTPPPGEGILVRDELAEIDFGRCSGLTLDAAYRAFPGLQEARALDRWNHPWPGGESYAQAVRRLGPLPAELTDSADVLLIAHQSVNRALLHILLGLPVEEVLASEQPSDCVVRVDRGGCFHTRIPADAPASPVPWRPGLLRSEAS